MSKRVLIVDRDELMCWGLTREFSAHGLAVRSVRSGAAALRAVRDQGWELVFVALDLDDLPGIELLARMRQRAPRTEFFVLGCDATPEIRRRAFAIGAAQFVDKPFDSIDVLNAARSALGEFRVCRDSPRFLCRIGLRLVVRPSSEGEPSVDNVEGRALDVSRGGARLLTRYPLRTGQTIEIHPTGPESGPYDRLIREAGAGSVVWTAQRRRRLAVGLRLDRGRAEPSISPGRIS